MRRKDARSLPSVAQADIRRKAVKGVLGGRTQVEVAEVLGVTRQAIGRWMKGYRKGGMKALRAKPRGRPKGGALQSWQAAQIARVVVAKTPDQLKLPFCLWTREAVAQWIERRFGISLSLWTVGRYLARWGFTPQKPARRAFEQNPAQVRRWLRREYPAIQKQAIREQAEIYWGDAMGLRSDHLRGRSYGLRGKTPVIPVPGKRFGCNMISAITNRGRLYFMVFKSRFHRPVFLDFLRRLIRQIRRKLFLIVDRHPVHRSARVKKWLAQNVHRLRLFYLPEYSPELNPDEMLNQDVKSHAVGRRRARHQGELLANVRGYLRSRQRQPRLVQRYFHAKTVLYAAA